MREGELNDKFFSHPTGRWSKLAYQILHHPVFHVFDLLLSIALMLLAVIEKPSVFGDESSERPLVSVGHGCDAMHALLHDNVNTVTKGHTYRQPALFS